MSESLLSILPFFGSNWAFLIYSIILLAVVYYMLTIRLNRLRSQDQLEMKELETERLKELDQVKGDFFSNVTHEFRTPLTLILGHLEQVIPTMKDPQAQKELKVVHRNAKHLEKLINQLLDISKLESNKMELDLRHGDVVVFVQEITETFRSLADRNRITLNFQNQVRDLEMDFDPDKVELIFFNLLSNAFKFTEKGTITVKINKVEIDGKDHLEVGVQDTGLGIVEEQIPKVFDRYYQSQNSRWRKNKGTGIGLALVKELVELHGGTIGLKSISGVGTEITVQLPAYAKLKMEDGKVIDIPSLRPEQLEAEAEAVDYKEAAFTDADIEATNIVLVVEDNKEIRDFLRLTLEPEYKVFESEDGEAGLKKAMDMIPDLVLSDVMMPKMDGFEMTKALKKSEKTSHVPIVLLTAKAAIESKIEGIEIGADAYVPKPFSSKELKATIHNLIEGRRRLKDKFSRQLLIRPDRVDEPSMEEKFLLKVREVVQEHLDDEHFSVEELSRKVGMSRAQIHRKLSALTGKSASRFVRSYRLQHAMQLLESHAGTVSEIAYKVGFSSPAYFTKCFSEEYGMSPSQVRK
ncbi:MAG: signal transduction histidine kinase/DNA-binding response OmpR family regulator [Flavobacteriales bacterium]|jgi:signal transduction histidine kinase/DNA-binding response OmpR family regulator